MDNRSFCTKVLSENNLLKFLRVHTVRFIKMVSIRSFQMVSQGTFKKID